MSMYYPQLEDTEKDSSFIRAFNGLNHTEVIDESMFFDMENCCTDKYPLLTRRKLRMLSPDVNANVIGTMNGLAWVANGYFYYKGVQKFAVSGTVKQLVQFGAYICVFPQGITYNTQTDEYEPMAVNQRFYISIGAVPRLRLDDDTTFHFDSEGDTPPTSPTDGYYWVDTSGEISVVKKWSAYQNMWISIPNIYYDIPLVPVDESGTIVSIENLQHLKVGDAITLSGLEDLVDGNTTYKYSRLNGSHIIQGIRARQSDVIVTIIGEPYLLVGSFGDNKRYGYIARELPQMDFVCANAGHLFGCSNANHEIYVSANATPFNWNVFEGTAADSYAEVVGTPGDFTGCIAYRSTVLFFKEDLIHILYGKRPSAYQLDQLECVGLQKGCHNTLAVANETLFYKGKYGVYAYSGGLPELISDALGDYNKLTMTAGGSDGQKYFISGGGYVFSYDPRRGLWAKEDNRDILQFAENGLDLYFIEYNSNGTWGQKTTLPRNNTSGTSHGVTFTINEDGSITANGTATDGWAQFYSWLTAVGEPSAYTTTQDTLLTGCPDGGSSQTYYLAVADGNGGYRDYGEGVVLPQGYEIKYVYISIPTGVSVSNLVFKPSIQTMVYTSVGAMDNYPNIATETGLTFTSESNGLEWSATSGWIGLDSPDEKYISRLRLRLEIPLGSVFIVETAYDNNDTFTEVERVNGDGLRPVFINILPRRCDVMRLRFRGIGDFKLYSIAKQYEQGSDAY